MTKKLPFKVHSAIAMPPGAMILTTEEFWSEAITMMKEKGREATRKLLNDNKDKWKWVQT